MGKTIGKGEDWFCQSVVPAFHFIQIKCGSCLSFLDTTWNIHSYCIELYLLMEDGMGKRFLVLAAAVLMWSSIAWARPALYVGMEAGYTSLNHLVELEIGSFPGLQLTPVVGIVPLSGLPGFSVEFNFMTELFGWESQVPPQELRAWILSPQLVAVYTFLEEPVRPFAGLGLGPPTDFRRCE